MRFPELAALNACVNCAVTGHHCELEGGIHDNQKGMGKVKSRPANDSFITLPHTCWKAACGGIGLVGYGYAAPPNSE